MFELRHLCCSHVIGPRTASVGDWSFTSQKRRSTLPIGVWGLLVGQRRSCIVCHGRPGLLCRMGRKRVTGPPSYLQRSARFSIFRG